MLQPLLEKIITPGVTDMHLKADEPPLIRQVGELIPIGTEPVRKEDIDTMLNSMLNEAQRAVLKETGSLSFSHILPGLGRLRVNVYRQKDANSIAIRFVPLDNKTFEQLNLPKDTMERLCSFRQGLILISGMSAAGKTTTLNALINYINENYTYNIITLEEPIETAHVRKKCSISQRDIGRDASNMKEAIDHILNQDPDIIVFGEMHSAEVFQFAIDAAASGHLVLGTLGSIDAMDTIERALNYFSPDRQAFARIQMTNVLKAIVAQRLIKSKNGRLFYPATEIMLVTPQTKKMIQLNSVSEVKFQLEKGGAFGMHTFDQDITRMFEAGLIGVEDAVDAASNPADMRMKMQVPEPIEEPGETK